MGYLDCLIYQVFGRTSLNYILTVNTCVENANSFCCLYIQTQITYGI